MKQEADRRQDLGLSLLPLEPEPHRCENGWLPDVDGCAMPCLKCKSHLHLVRSRDGRASWWIDR